VKLPRKLLIAVPLVVGLILVGTFMPARQMTIEGFGTLSFDSTVTLSVGSEAAHASAPANEWWDTDYQHRKKITVSSNGGIAVPDEYSVSFSEDTASLISASKLRPDGNDWRIAYWDGSSWIELDRHVRSGWDSANTETWFKTQAAIGGGASDDNYYVYYGYSAETGTPPSYWSDSMGADAPSRVYWFADDFEEHNSGDDPDGWTDQSDEDFYVALHGSERWFQVNTFARWEDGSTATGMDNIGDAVWSATVYYHQEGDNAWGGIGVHVDNGDIGRIVVIRDGGWYQADEPDWANPYGGGWQSLADIHFPIDTKGRIELITEGANLDAYWYNPPGYSPEKVTIFTGLTIPADTGKLDVHVERPGTNPDSDRWIDADDIIVRKYVNPEPTTSLETEETLDITNLPNSKDFGIVSTSTDYWAYGGTTAPAFPLDSSECYFTITNNSTSTVDISIRATDFSGGDDWNLVTTSPGAGEARMKAGREGDNEGDMVTLTNGDQAFISGLAASKSKAWELKLETGGFTDGVQKTSTITLTATLA
jgi:hypothetical protein